MRKLSVVVRPLPVLYACAGCREFGYAAPRVASALDRRGLVEARWLGGHGVRLAARFPILALDACPKRCAKDWIEIQGREVQAALLITPEERDDPESAARRLSREVA